jgi:Ni,Fe-hydrogenase I small subunit
MLTTLALLERYSGQTVAAPTKAKKPALVWLESQDWADCTESMLRSSAPDVARAVLDLLSWEYHETVMAGSGTRASAALDRSVKEERANIWWWWKGWIPTNDGGVH